MITSLSSDLLAFSHLRWDWVYQRPQHLMSRAARDRRVFYIEEPIHDASAPELQLRVVDANLCVVTPHLPVGLDATATTEAQASLLHTWIEQSRMTPETLWYWTPAALAFTSRLQAGRIVYDCMDELSAFAGASPELRTMERSLLQRADVVFTGGVSLYEAKRALHPNVHAMPSCVDLEHFRAARHVHGEFPPQAHIPHPRIGFCGVLDERLDLALVAGLAAAEPGWQFIFAGPVVKIDPATLPQAANIHYLGPCQYADLPQLMAGWDLGWLPFALNEATRFISPTKTPEYLAAGLPVVSSAIRDVVRTWGETGFVAIAGSVTEFRTAIAAQLETRTSSARLGRVDRTLAFHSWDALWYRMERQMRLTATNAA